MSAFGGTSLGITLPQTVQVAADGGDRITKRIAAAQEVRVWHEPDMARCPT
jgi:urocanate hydratase